MSDNMPNTIRRQDLFRVFLRSFFVQSVWNYRSLISIGFGICLIPIVKRLYSDHEQRQAFMDRHLQYFNAHPYMASYALGVSIRLEEACAAGDDSARHKLARVKNVMISVLGAMGDRLFWLTIKPFSMIIGVMALLWIPTTGGKVAALMVTFLIYNVPHLYMRYQGIFKGYEYGMEIQKYLNRDRFRNLQHGYLVAGVVAFIILLGGIFWKMAGSGYASVLAFMLSGLLASILFNVSKNFYLTAFLTFAMAIFAGVWLIN